MQNLKPIQRACSNLATTPLPLGFALAAHVFSRLEVLIRFDGDNYFRETRTMNSFFQTAL
jgi:hypothetical protein